MISSAADQMPPATMPRASAGITFAPSRNAEHARELHVAHPEPAAKGDRDEVEDGEGGAPRDRDLREVGAVVDGAEEERQRGDGQCDHVRQPARLDVDRGEADQHHLSRAPERRVGVASEMDERDRGEREGAGSPGETGAPA